MTIPRIFPVCGALMVLIACAPSTTPDARSAAVAEAADEVQLVPTLRVRVQGDTVSLELGVANGGAEPVVLTFGSAQRYDFAVEDGAGSEVWRWSADRTFAQAVSEEAVPPGGSLAYHESWVAPSSGRYRVRAWLVSADHPLDLESDFEVPGH